MDKILQKRVLKLNQAPEKKGLVVYWMSRDQRAVDNWALFYAQRKAIAAKRPLVVVFTLVPTFLEATIRQYDFMLQGLREVQEDLLRKQISFFLLLGEPALQILKFVRKEKAGLLVTDFDPLKIKRTWKKKVLKDLKVAFYEVDAHNTVPYFQVSDKQEYAARTIRPKINNLLDYYLIPFPKLKKHPYRYTNKGTQVDFAKIKRSLKVDKSVRQVSSFVPGSKEAIGRLSQFRKIALNNYADLSNDPNAHARSRLSPYLHFGQISAARIALEVKRSKARKADQDAFLEELIVRKELSDNFCFYNQNYDNPKCFPNWAKVTLKAHIKDKREYLYKKEDFEKAKTHDPVWNAAQIEMVKTGYMHSYLRMYWAKKILEWTKTPAEAMKIAIDLNNKYELDGRDPNGYTGIAWSIGGVHDRAFKEREVFGKVRYMSYTGLKRKFDILKYIDKIEKL